MLQDLIEEDERVLETWYLFAICLHAGGEHSEAASAVERGQALAKTLGMPADDPLVLAFADTKVGAKSACKRKLLFKSDCLVMPSARYPPEHMLSFLPAACDPSLCIMTATSCILSLCLPGGHRKGYRCW